jgi:hypothetical protein
VENTPLTILAGQPLPDGPLRVKSFYTLWMGYFGVIFRRSERMMGSEYLVKVVAWLLSIIGAAGLIAGLLGFFGPVLPALVGLSPWLLTIVGFLFILSGYGLMNRDLDEV